MQLEWRDIEKRIKENNFDSFLLLKLNTDAYRINLKHRFDPMSVVAIGKIDPLPHQIEAFVKMIKLLRPYSGIEGRIRFLLADETGLGKTIMVSLVAKELILRGKIRRILIVTPPSELQIQWKEELNDKFNESFKIIRGKIEGNPYKEENRAIISVDIGRSPKKLELLLQASWDLIIFDEAHKLKPGNLRYDLASKLSQRTKHLILVTATPHDGKIKNFMALVKLIDEGLECNTESGELKKFIEPLWIRRLKEGIIDFNGRKIFLKREQPLTVNIDYAPEEKDFYDRVEDYVTTYYRKAKGKNAAIFALYVLRRRVSSSIKAGVISLKKRKIRLLEPYIDENIDINYIDYLDDLDDKKREKVENILLGAAITTGEDLKVELERLDKLIDIGERLILQDIDSKCKKFMHLIKEFRKEKPDEKIIVFTEFVDTLRFLEQKLICEGFIVSKIKGGMDIEEQKEQALLFKKHSHILLGTETAGEGINLQFANIEINYELVWNPNRYEHRIGRVYRYGQEKRVFIYNLKTGFPIDNAVMRKMQEKTENIRAIFGEAAIDVIGSLISEKDMLEIFKARDINSAVDKIDEILKEKLEIFKEIDKFLIKERFDLVNIKELTTDISHSINNFDIKRFFLSYIQQKELAEYMCEKDDQYCFSIPRFNPKTKKSNTNYEFVGSFDKKSKGNYIALGHPVLEAAIKDCLEFNPISVAYSNERGILVTFILKFFNGLDLEIYSEPILLFKNNKELKVLDALAIWDYDLAEFDKSANVDIQNIDEYKQLLSEVLKKTDILEDDKIEYLKQFVEKKNLNDLETEYNLIYSEYDWKIRNQKRKMEDHINKGQNYLISGIDKKISDLKLEYKKILFNHQKSKTIRMELYGPVNITLILPYRKNGGEILSENRDFEDLKKLIELEGMKIAMNHEIEKGRKPIDVSTEFGKGYDIDSRSSSETRYIEVKSSVTEDPIEITSNEWRAAYQLKDEYYLYIVRNALTEPKLLKIKNPYQTIEKYINKVTTEDFRIILGTLPEDFEYSN